MRRPVQARSRRAGRLLPAFSAGLRNLAVVALVAVSAAGAAARPAAADPTNPSSPHIVHAPVATAYFEQPVPITANATCSALSCSATLAWAVTGGLAKTAPMTAGTPTAVANGTSVWSFAEVIPASDVTTLGVDYSITVSDGTFTDTTPTYHITVLAPTAIVHVPTVTANVGQTIPIEAVVPCSTSACNVSLSYAVTPDGVGSTPSWTTVTMTPSGPTAVGQATVVQTWTATIPAGVVTSRGVDYYLHATDGFTNAYSPGTAYAATSFVQADGTGLEWFHVTTAAVNLVHLPVTTAYPNQPISLSATVTCPSRSCSATMSYRTSVELDGTALGLENYLLNTPTYTTVAMTPTVVEDLGAQGTVLRFDATIPAGAVTTEGVDYYLHATDGSTDAYYPGTSYVGGIGSVDGLQAAWQHVEVFSRPQIIHTPPGSYTQGQSLQLTATVVVSTYQQPTVTLWYGHSSDTVLTAVPMVLKQTPVVTAEGIAYQAVGAVPASTTAEGGIVQYYISAFDGYQTAYSPDTATAPPVIGYLVAVASPPA
jgi:hypothetical protein